MQTQLKKWGNSLALRIPSHILQELQIGENSVVSIYQEGNKIVIVPVVPTHTYTLKELLDGVMPDNLHTETDTGEVVGNEAW